MFRKSVRPRHGTVVAYLALFVALGGTSYAAVSLSRNDVRSKHIKNGHVKKRDIAKNAVNSRRVKDGTLLSKDFKPGQLVEGAPGPAGPAGPAGPEGPTGPPGPSTGAAGGDLTGNYPDPEIAGGAVGTAELANGGVTSAKVNDNSLTNSDLGAASVHADEFGAATFTLGNTVTAPNGQVTNATLSCPAGTRMLSGGPIVGSPAANFYVVGTHPNTSNQWRVQMWNASGASKSFRIVVHCLLA